MNTQTQTPIPERLHKKPGAVNEQDLTTKTNTLTPDRLHKMNAYWRAAIDLSAAQIECGSRA